MTENSDPLFEVRNSYYIGNFQQCINEAQKIRTPSTEKDAFMYLAYIGLKKYGVVMDEISSRMPKELQMVRVLAEFLSTNSDARQKIVEELDQKLLSIDPEDNTSLIVGATLYYYEENYENALRILSSSEELECMAFMIQTFLKIDRVDLARKKLKEMFEKDEDATLSQLAQAWINVYMGGDKFQEAYYIFQEICDKFSSTPLLLNGLTVSLIGQGKYDEVESLLQEALDKDSNNPETLINLMTASQHLGKAPEISNRYLNQLKDSNYRHSFVGDYISKENEFNRLVKQYSPA